MLFRSYLEGDATSHVRVLREGKPDWDLDVVAGPRGAVLFALDLAYVPDREERVFRFGPPREATFAFRVPAYLRGAAEVLRVDADGVVPVPHATADETVTIRDRASRVAVYVMAAKPGESQRLEARRRTLVAAEEALGFDPGRKPEDVEALRAMLGPVSQ